MVTPYYFALYWNPSGLGPLIPTASIIAKAYVTEPDGLIRFGSHCVTKSEIDFEIDRMIGELQEARVEAHKRFDH